MVTHPDTNKAQRGFTLVIQWELLCSTYYRHWLGIVIDQGSTYEYN
jgi:hypothetical protein